MDSPIHNRLWSETYEPRRRSRAIAEVIPFAAVCFVLAVVGVVVEVWR